MRFFCNNIKGGGNPYNLAGSVPNVPTYTQHSVGIWSEATSPPLSKGDLGGMSILNHKERSQNFDSSLCDSVGGDGWSCLFQTFKVLCDSHQISSHNTHRQIHRPSYSESMCDNTLIYNNINMYVILFLCFLSCLSVLVRFAAQR